MSRFLRFLPKPTARVFKEIEGFSRFGCKVQAHARIYVLAAQCASSMLRAGSATSRHVWTDASALGCTHHGGIAAALPAHKGLLNQEA
ncbi:MAG: hypothetical protein AAF636_07355 [Pseudomonadota bacterium]